VNLAKPHISSDQEVIYSACITKYEYIRRKKWNRGCNWAEWDGMPFWRPEVGRVPLVIFICPFDTTLVTTASNSGH
jgi:hypothetical protein